MTPLGHVAVGYLLGRTARTQAHVYAWIVAGAAAFVDVDFVIMLWSSPRFNAWHRVVTHNLVFVLAVAVLAMWPIAKRCSLSLPWVFAALVAGGLSHVLIDSCLDTNASNGVGVALWWPISSTMFSPFNLVSTTGPATGWGDPAGAAASSAIELLFEVPFVIVAAWLVWSSRRRS